MLSREQVPDCLKGCMRCADWLAPPGPNAPPGNGQGPWLSFGCMHGGVQVAALEAPFHSADSLAGKRSLSWDGECSSYQTRAKRQSPAFKSRPAHFRKSTQVRQRFHVMSGSGSPVACFEDRSAGANMGKGDVVPSPISKSAKPARGQSLGKELGRPYCSFTPLRWRCLALIGLLWRSRLGNGLGTNSREEDALGRASKSRSDRRVALLTGLSRDRLNGAKKNAMLP